MDKTNKQIFEEYPPDVYLKTVEKASRIFKEIGDFPDSLGFLVLHRGHAPSAFQQEIPACLVLKKLGFRVVLDEEEPERGTPDAKINDEKFELKQVSKAKNLRKAVIYQFRNTYSKAKRLLLHIAQTANEEQIRGALFAATSIYHKIETIWVVYEGRLFQFNRSEILKGKHRFSPKK